MPPDLPGLHREYARSDPWAWAALAVMVAAAYLAARMVTWLGLSVASAGWTRCKEGHWTERARLAWPGRTLAPLVLFLVPIPLLIAFITPPIFLPRFGREEKFGELLPTTSVVILFLAVGVLGVMQARSAWERRVNPAVALTPRARRAAPILGAITLAFCVWAPYALLARILIRREDLELAIIGGGLLLGVAYRFGGGIVLLRWTRVLRPASDRLRAIAGSISERMGIRTRSVEVLALPQANALAFPLRGRIAVTDAALAVLDDDELSAVCAHELAHLSEPRWVGVARLLWSLHLLLLIALVVLTVSLTDRVFEFETGVALCVAGDILWLCGLIFYSRLHRRMEVRADAMARQFEGETGTYARALEKLHETNAIPMVIGSQNGLYPELYDRLVSSGVAPDYPRPAPPPRAPFYQGLLVLIVASAAGGFGLDWLASAIQ